MSELEDLKRKAKEIEKTLIPINNRIEVLQGSKKEKEMEKKVGRYYRYKDNSYGHTKTWDVFYKVIGVESPDDYRVISLQKDCYGDIEIKLTETSDSLFHEEVSKDIFEQAYNLYLSEIHGQFSEFKKFSVDNYHEQ